MDYNYFYPDGEDMDQLNDYGRQQPERYFGQPAEVPSPTPMTPPPAFSPFL